MLNPDAVVFRPASAVFRPASDHWPRLPPLQPAPSRATLSDLNPYAAHFWPESDLSDSDDEWTTDDEA
jgi:hypothetical protein